MISVMLPFPASNVHLTNQDKEPKDESTMLKFKNSLTAMIGDFANMNRTPDFKAKSETTDDIDKSPERKAPGARRHSLNITVGAEELPQLPRRNRSESICIGTPASKLPPALAHLNKGRRSSAPVVSTSNASSSFKAKMKKMKTKDDTFQEEEDDTIQEEEEEQMLAKMAERERRPSSYLL